MIIKHIDGTEVDTNKLPDIDAQILEKTEELRILCESANRVFLLQIDTRGKQNLTCFWNFKSTTEPDKTQLQDSFGRLGHSTHLFFMQFSQNAIGLYPTRLVDISNLPGNE